MIFFFIYFLQDGQLSVDTFVIVVFIIGELSSLAGLKDISASRKDGWTKISEKQHFEETSGNTNTFGYYS